MNPESTTYHEPLPDLTATSLVKAKKSQLLFWIAETNQRAGTKALNKSARTNDELRQRLAGYYSLNNSVPSVTSAVLGTNKSAETSQLAAGLSAIDRDIQNRQWAHLRALGSEWMEKIERQEEFHLLQARTTAGNLTGEW